MKTFLNKMGISSDSPAAQAPMANGVNGVKKPKVVPTHRLGPVTGEEISRSSRLVAQSWPEGTQFRFKSIKLREPPKSELMPYLEADRAGKELPAIERLIDVVYYLKNTVSASSLPYMCRG